ncbi:hypothetical protein BGW36DRAFT_430357 [Talaromyces proteolyticus]|uniref:Uncharacterized protein n=1 Tax=Talaromyces proteolyticus TaxID=1131652 RepID=A0AAD4KNN7_9EURO|nr:uncharacterized protein BGW36DRAFT_430357 [Talaromyces proteolyticus]KAH8692601.1 hypothetical protein BGW36DRAFT_430357 [Talaromyces proteolyticus]
MSDSDYVPDYEKCDATALDWASLVITFITVNVTWWLIDIPKTWKFGFRAYINAISWQCLRISLPSVAAVYAFYHHKETHEMAKIYYHGFHPDSEEQRRPMALMQVMRALVVDSLTIVATCMTIYKACHVTTDSIGDPTVSGWNISLWVYPTLPVAIMGFWMLAASYFRIRNPWILLAGGFLALALACVTFTLVLYYLSPLRNGNMWVASLILYIYLALPWSLILPGTPLELLILAMSVMVRAGGVTAGALSSDAYFPFCQLRKKAFGGVYLALGILAALFAIYARFKWDRVRYRLPWQARQPRHAQQTTYEPVQLIAQEDVQKNVSNVQAEQYGQSQYGQHGQYSRNWSNQQQGDIRYT